MRNKLNGMTADFDGDMLAVRYPGFLRIVHKGIVMYLKGDLRIVPSKNIAVLSA